MNKFNIRLATPHDFPALAAFIEENNQSPAVHCIQASSGESAENLLEELEKLDAAGEVVFVIAEEDDEWTGILGSEYALPEQRAWLRGPLIRSGNNNPGETSQNTYRFQEMVGALYHAWLDALPPEICKFDTFLNVENKRGQAFYASMGFWERSRHHVYVAMRPDQIKVPRLVCAPMRPEQLKEVQTLHNTVFPGIRTGEDVLQGLDDDHRVWVYTPEEELLGYVFAVIEPWAEGGYVEFLGVRADARGKAVGASLLATALQWCFAERNVPEVGLTVEDGNVNARGMYERAGFRLLYSGVNHRLERGKHGQ